MTEVPEGFAEHVQRQFPLPPDHPDFQRLRLVVDRVEQWTTQGRSPEAAYGELMDLYSVVYLAVNRSTADALATETRARQAEVNTRANSWTEGFLFGMLFAELGGHREPDGAEPEPAEQDAQVVVIAGNPVDGITVYGPAVPNSPELEDFCETPPMCNQTWWLAPVQPIPSAPQG